MGVQKVAFLFSSTLFSVFELRAFCAASAGSVNSDLNDLQASISCHLAPCLFVSKSKREVSRHCWLQRLGKLGRVLDISQRVISMSNYYSLSNRLLELFGQKTNIGSKFHVLSVSSSLATFLLPRPAFSYFYFYTSPPFFFHHTNKTEDLQKTMCAFVVSFPHFSSPQIIHMNFLLLRCYFPMWAKNQRL